MMFVFSESKNYGSWWGGGHWGGYFTLPTPNDALTNGFQLEKKQDLVVSGGSKNINRLHCDGKGGVYLGMGLNKYKRGECKNARKQI